MQENLIPKIEGLDDLSDLRQLNLNENCVNIIEGLSGCSKLENLYLKRNRIGRDPCGDIESLKGLLDCPSLNCLDLSDNHLTD